MGQRGRDPTRGDDHRRVLPHPAGGGPARHLAVAAAELPQPRQQQPRHDHRDRQPHQVEQPHRPRDPVHDLLQRGQQPGGVAVGDGQHPAQQQQEPDPDQGHDRGGAGHIEWGGDPGQAAAVPPLPRLLRPLLPVGEPLVVPGRLGRAQQPLVAGVRARLPPPPRQHPRPGRDVEHPVAQQPAGRVPRRLVAGRPPDHPHRRDHHTPCRPLGGRATPPPRRCRAGTADGRRTNSAPRPLPAPSPHAPSSLAWPALSWPALSWLDGCRSRR